MAISESDVIRWWELYDSFTDLKASDTLTENGTVSTNAADPGAFGGSRDFDNSLDYLETSDTGVIYSWAVWIYPDTNHSGRFLNQDFTDASTRDWYLECRSDGTYNLVLRTNAGSFETSLGNVSYSSGAWNFLVVTITSSGADVYVNGSFDSSFGSAFTPANTSNDFQIGQRNAGSAYNPFNGKIAQVITFNRELTSTEINNLYNSGTGKTWDDYFGAEEATDNSLFFGGGL